jgi:hypothetical protein
MPCYSLFRAQWSAHLGWFAMDLTRPSSDDLWAGAIAPDALPRRGPELADREAPPDQRSGEGVVMSAQHRPGRPASVRDALRPIRLTFFRRVAQNEPASGKIDELGSPFHRGRFLPASVHRLRAHRSWTIEQRHSGFHAPSSHPAGSVDLAARDQSVHRRGSCGVRPGQRGVDVAAEPEARGSAPL